MIIGRFSQRQCKHLCGMKVFLTPYEQLKKLSRGSKLTQDSYIDFIENLDISNVSKTKLLALTPSTYIGIAPTLSK
jgi:adenylosuccinate lyase